MMGKRLILGIALLLLAAPRLLAQPEIVNIRMTGEPRAIAITPNVTAVCRNSNSCPTKLDFRWVGPKGSDPSERIVVEYKDGLYWNEAGEPAVNPASECFSFPGEENPFVLEHGPGNGRTLTFRSDNESCEDKVAFFFDIRCQNEANDNCGGVEPLDPGTMVDNGRRP